MNMRKTVPDAQNLTAYKNLITSLLGDIYSSSCERQCKANVTITKYFCFFINVTRSLQRSE